MWPGGDSDVSPRHGRGSGFGCPCLYAQVAERLFGAVTRQLEQGLDSLREANLLAVQTVRRAAQGVVHMLSEAVSLEVFNRRTSPGYLAAGAAPHP